VIAAVYCGLHPYVKGFGRPMRNLSFVTPLAAALCVSACSLAQLTDSEIQEARRGAISSQAEYQQIASVVVQSSIVFANSKDVRYRLDDNSYRTNPWEAVQLSAVVRNEVRNFIATRHAEAIFTNQHRVNFVLWGTGLAVSGVSLGVIVAPVDELGCHEVVASIKLDRRGLQCEKLSETTYLYLWR
jgi:hypothetical protein